MANPPAGWHPDPLNRHAQRYWDGNQWTEHVADQSGNMTTDPLDTGPATTQATGQQQAATGDWGGSTSVTETSTTTWGDPDPSAEDVGGAAGSGEPAWGTATDTPTDSWGSTDDSTTGQSSPDEAATWGQADDTGPDSDDTELAETGATDEPAWGTGGAAAGAAAVAGGVAADDDLGDTATADRDGTSDDPSATSASSADVDHPAIARIEVGDGVVVRHGRVVATTGGVTLGDSNHPGSLSATGDGTLYVGAGGRQITILDVPASGLTVHDDALVAHSGELERSAAADGIVGYDGTAVRGAGWVAIAAVGGARELSPTDGVDVSVHALVAWSNDLEVSHAEHVNLRGHGVVLVSAGA